MFNNNRLQTSLITCVFATNFAVGCFHASFEKHFVKKIQHLIFFLEAYQILEKFRCFFSSYELECDHIAWLFADAKMAFYLQKQETFKHILYDSGSFLTIQKEVGAGCYQPRGIIS